MDELEREVVEREGRGGGGDLEAERRLWEAVGSCVRERSVS